MPISPALAGPSEALPSQVLEFSKVASTTTTGGNGVYTPRGASVGQFALGTKKEK